MVKTQATWTIFEGEITVHLGDDNGNLYKLRTLIGKTIRNMNEVLESMPWERISK